MEKKLLIGTLIPPIVIVLYSLYFHLNFVSVMRNIDPKLLILFISTYLAQIAVLALRDSRIAQVSYFTAFKARLLGNSVGLVIPGWAGQDLARASVYSRYNRDIVKSFAFSLNEAMYDVVIGSLLFLALVDIKASSIDLIYVLTALGNVVVWTLGMGYVIFTSRRVIRAEEKLVNFLKLKNYYFLLQKGKEKVREATTWESIFINSALTVLGYLIQSVAFYYVVPSFAFDVLINMTYFAASLIPVPASSGFAELGLSIYFHPNLVVAIRILELINYSLGFIFIREISLNHLKSQFNEIRSYGKLSERSGT
ncbi:MAG: lysylphosphatidylglycerol synthase domain-containing protein [Metallosphaera sp.]